MCGEQQRRGLEGPGLEVGDCLRLPKDYSWNFFFFECKGHLFILEKLVLSEDVADPILYFLFRGLEYR